MLKRIIALLLLALMIFTFCACGNATVHCDRCGKEIRCDKKITEEWIIFCAECEEEIGPIVE